MKYLFIFLLPLLVLAGTLISVPQAKAVSEYDSIIDTYSDPKGFDDDYYVQTNIFDVKEFTVRELADYIGLNDEQLNLYNVTYNPNGTTNACTNQQRLDAASALRNGRFIGQTQDYYNGSQRVLGGAIFTTMQDVDLLGDVVFNSTLHAFNNRGVYKGGFLSSAPQEYPNISVSIYGDGFQVSCYVDPDGKIAGTQWTNTAVQTRLFTIGYLYDSWYPDDTASWNVWYLNYMPSSVEVIYPSGYEGEGIPDFPLIEEETPPVENEFAPNWYISNIIDNKGKFHDQNFNTFDGNPFLCEGDLAPVLYWEIFRIADDDTEYKMFEGYQSATAEINIDFGPAEIDRDYLILGWYDCGDDNEFTEQGRAYFSITRAGTLKVDLFEACMMAEFPFINAQGCINNLYTTINLLYFGEVAFPTFTFNPACHNLNMMDDWLNLPNGYQVCPQIPSFVRNVTTPFVAFMLGLVTMGFIKRIRGDFDG